MEKTVYIEGTGCNRRQLDLGKIRRYLTMNGYILVDKPEAADYIVLGTCAFKKTEEDVSVLRLREMVSYKSKKLLVYGCLPDIAGERFREFSAIPKVAPKEIEKIEGFFHDIVIPFGRIPESHTIESNGLSLSRLKTKVQSGEIFTREFFTQIRTTGRKKLNNLIEPANEYYLFICRGCVGKCSYCAIARSIGKVKSKNPTEVREEFRAGVDNGHRDFILLGDDPGCYGLDIATTFPELLAPLLDDGRSLSAGSPRQPIHFHLKEIHPKFMLLYRRQLTRLLASSQIKTVLCPIQSGSDRILALMQREHAAGDLTAMTTRIKEKNSGCHLTTQMIVGFPSETDDEFRQTLDAVKNSAFDSVVVFPYHDKEGTPASRLSSKVSDRVIKLRVRQAFKFFRKEGIKAFYNCP